MGLVVLFWIIYLFIFILLRERERESRSRRKDSDGESELFFNLKIRRVPDAVRGHAAASALACKHGYRRVITRLLSAAAAVGIRLSVKR